MNGLLIKKLDVGRVKKNKNENCLKSVSLLHPIDKFV